MFTTTGGVFPAPASGALALIGKRSESPGPRLYERSCSAGQARCPRLPGVTVSDYPPPPLFKLPRGDSETSFKLPPLVSNYPLSFTG